ncbi:MAG: putative enoyl-CoA hydratase echA8 [Calditrichaeota bacterium]|nr:putative enoyl-CoA hydratase echA8 [Calditrichota bacterium]
MKTMRQSTLTTLGIGPVLGFFRNGGPPESTESLVDAVFGPEGDRGALVISGGNGIVGSGKAMQLGSRLLEYGVPVVTLDLPDAPDGIGGQYGGLKASFGRETANEIMANIVRLNYGGKELPPALAKFNPRFVLEAVPEILPIKRAHYELMRGAFPDAEIRSVTSGFPGSELGVGILHPSFPHPINKVWEVVEDEPSAITRLFWSLGLVPVPVADYWSFILDVLFCGVTLAALRYQRASNMPFWKVDKYVRRLVGPNPFRAHDAIGPGASFLTWSCLHHLAEQYGDLFAPENQLVRRKESGESWYSSNRPTVDWELADEDEFNAWMLGPLFQMTSLMLHEQRAHLSHMNAIGELCAQFTKGIVATARNTGADEVIRRVETYHRLHPDAKNGTWHPEEFDRMDTPEWKQLYVNAEHDGEAGAITLGRESLNWDVIHELDRAIDWLKEERIDRVVLTGDFHLTTQLVGADTSEFYPALHDREQSYKMSKAWSETARRFNDEFALSVGFINGKRCLGGMLELLMHCHYLVADQSAQLGMPEVTLPVLPGMEGCHWPLRRASREQWPRLLAILLGGRFVRAKDTAGWLTDYAGPFADAVAVVGKLLSGGDHGLRRRPLAEKSFEVPAEARELPPAESPAAEAARKAVMDCIRASCAAPLSEALVVQARHSAEFMVSQTCLRGAIGASYSKTMDV